MDPWLYHAHHIHNKEDVSFWLGLAARAAGPVLELGCGTGRVLVPLAEAGIQAYGLDHDRGMLNFLRENLPTHLKHSINLIQADMTTFHLTASFPLIIMPCNTLSTFLPAERRAVLFNTRPHLSSNGRFAASVPNPDLLTRLPPRSEAEVEELILHPVTKNPVQISSSWKSTRERLVVNWMYDHLLPNGRVDRQIVEARYYIVSTQVYLDELSQVGFSSIETFGDFDRSPYNDKAPYFIFVARV